MLDFDAIADAEIERRNKVAVVFVQKLKENDVETYKRLRELSEYECMRELVFAIDNIDFITTCCILDELRKE